MLEPGCNTGRTGVLVGGGLGGEVEGRGLVGSEGSGQ